MPKPSATPIAEPSGHVGGMNTHVITGLGFLILRQKAVYFGALGKEDGGVDETNEDGWRRVRQEVDARRVEMKASWDRVYELTGVSDGTYRAMAKGKPLKGDVKRRSLTDGLGWTPDSIDRILAGQPPQLINPPERDRYDELAAAVKKLQADVRRLAALVEGR
jgi:hypothetical protein